MWYPSACVAASELIFLLCLCLSRYFDAHAIAIATMLFFCEWEPCVRVVVRAKNVPLRPENQAQNANCNNGTQHATKQHRTLVVVTKVWRQRRHHQAGLTICCNCPPFEVVCAQWDLLLWRQILWALLSSPLTSNFHWPWTNCLQFPIYR